MIEYDVRLASPQAHLFEVQCTIFNPDPKGQTISMPAWIPGSYLIRDFARHIVSMAASCDGKAVTITKTDKHTWQCAPCGGSLHLRYSVYAFDLSVRMAYLDTTRAYFNGTSLFLQVHGHEDAACGMTLHKPKHLDKSWQVATGMAAEKTDKRGFGRYLAANYAELIDCPVEIGELAVADFKAGGIPHRIVVSGHHQADLKRIARDLKTLCTHHLAFFGEAPFSRYEFMLYAAGDDQYGGLEHSNSTSLICPRSWLPSKGEQLNEKGYQDFLGLCSHEYFHAWHVKRIRPLAFQQAELGREAYTRMLWVFEGFTAYYDSLALVRSGLISREDYLKDLSESITRLLRTPGRTVQALEESSFDAWVKLYRPDENTPNAQISYYLKGSLVALALDLTLRAHNSSLDEVMRVLWQQYGKTGTGVTEDAIEKLAAQICSPDIGPHLKKFFDIALRGTEDLPLAELLAPFGVEYKVAVNGAAAKKQTQQSSALGIKLANGGEAKLMHVYSGGAAEQAGLAGGDVVIALDGIKVSAQNLEKMVSHKAPGTKIRIHAFRRDELMEFKVVTQAAPADSCTLTLSSQPTPQAMQLLDNWLGKMASVSARE